MKDIIVGSGPVGSYTGQNLKNCTILEEHKEIGKPIQCAGLLTQDIYKLAKVGYINKIKHAEIITKHSQITFKLQKPNLIVDRNHFDKEIAKQAVDEGCKILLNHKVTGFKGNNIVIKNKNKIKKIKYNNLIGADGASSIVRKEFFSYKPKYWFSIQARVKLKNNNQIKFFPKIGTFSWIIPENENIVRIATAYTSNPKQIFKKFCEQWIKKKDILEYQGGIIPIYQPKINAQQKNKFIVGDAAGQVKATTGGGIIPGMLAGKTLAYSIICNKDYNKEWKKVVGNDLLASLMIRKVLNNLSEKDYTDLINKINNEKIKYIIETTSRDEAFKLGIKLLLKKPSLLLYARKIF